MRFPRTFYLRMSTAMHDDLHATCDAIGIDVAPLCHMLIKNWLNTKRVVLEPGERA